VSVIHYKNVFIIYLEYACYFIANQKTIKKSISTMDEDLNPKVKMRGSSPCSCNLWYLAESCNGYPYPWVPNTHPYPWVNGWVMGMGLDAWVGTRWHVPPFKNTSKYS